MCHKRVLGKTQIVLQDIFFGGDYGADFGANARTTKPLSAHSVVITAGVSIDPRFECGMVSHYCCVIAREHFLDNPSQWCQP
jgi:hypothetical protein